MNMAFFPTFLGSTENAHKSRFRWGAQLEEVGTLFDVKSCLVYTLGMSPEAVWAAGKFQTGIFPHQTSNHNNILPFCRE